MDHLTSLATTEFRAWTVYAWQRAKVLDADPSGLWTGIAEALVKAIGQVPTLGSENPGRQKHR